MNLHLHSGLFGSKSEELHSFSQNMLKAKAYAYHW